MASEYFTIAWRLSLAHREEDSLVAMLRFQEFERSTVDTEGAMGLAAILAGQLPELKGKKWVGLVEIVIARPEARREISLSCHPCRKPGGHGQQQSSPDADSHLMSWP